MQFKLCINEKVYLCSNGNKDIFVNKIRVFSMYRFVSYVFVLVKICVNGKMIKTKDILFMRMMKFENN